MSLPQLTIACLVLFLLEGCASPNEENGPVRPNIVLILTDDQGWGDLSMNGNEMLSTPNIDKMASEGVTFDRFYVCPVCSPTRAEILTGRYHVRGGVYSTSAGGERLDLDEVTFAQLLQEAGYQTAAFGKWHNGMQYPYHPNARGFAEYYGFCSGHWGNYFDALMEHNGELVMGNGFMVDDLTDKAIEFLEANQANSFFVYLPFNTPHSPMQVPDRWWNRFKNKELSQLHRFRNQEDLDHTRAAYAMCENIDWNVGRVLDKLEALSLTENTIVIFLSDNGPNGARWNGDMKGRKGSTDEGGVRSPMIMQWKGTLQAGKIIDQISGAIDLFPTLMDLAGIKHQNDKSLDGRSLRPLLMEGDPEWEDRYIFNYWNERLSVRSQQYRLDHVDQLYDMDIDPGQRTDISGSADEIFEAMKVAKTEWERTVLTELDRTKPRSFPVGHRDFRYTQLPARDGLAHGNISRSNRYPNCSFFTNWTSVDDSITWEVEVQAAGQYEAVIYYTCVAENMGVTLQLSCGEARVQNKITEMHDPPLTGMEHDRVPRIESYVKDFKPFSLGNIKLQQGKGTMTLKATNIPGQGAVDFRLMMLNRAEEKL
ncbi:MAG: arylsulfatase [Saprospiraceae bacterium]|nr:arylsulfatase [Saprospiraceae bacterium]